jgi:7-cyano-7-deazaguanine reductase
MAHILGKKITLYPDLYGPETPSLLQPIARSLQRHTLPLSNSHFWPYYGTDWWCHYEMSYLEASTGWPVHGFLQIAIPAQSPFIIESKSLKLYLGSFANTLITRHDLLEKITLDLSHKAEDKVVISFHVSSAPLFVTNVADNGERLDLSSIDVPCSCYDYNPGLLELKPPLKREWQRFFFGCFRSNCLVTAQPDWAHIFIDILPQTKGSTVTPQSLLRYLTSFREHQEFHEHCVERIFCDLLSAISPENLTVYGAFFRRGCLDINPIRSLSPITEHWQRLPYH